MTTPIIVTIVVIMIVIIIASSSNSSNNLEKEIERLRCEYESFLQGRDRKAALKAGRLYHAMRKKDRSLNMYDELAIANDLSTMPQEIYTSPSVNSNDFPAVISSGTSVS